ncbi:MAG: hypothetical protein LQ343_006698 [Gyalolechia ehrenbergii]|nr:MAG: hypothetical protein LQ343_006698 [Gyalolechia ehrenbergii]
MTTRDEVRTETIKLKEPKSNRALTTREQIILLEASRLHGCRFPPWKNTPDDIEFELDASKVMFIDPDPCFRLSKIQLAVFDSWRRPDRLVSPGKEQQQLPTDPSMIAGEKVDLVQDVTSDCSVVASLCAEVARAERGFSTIPSSIFHPYDKTLQQPIRSENGKYIFRLYFNGCWRKVTIDDRLPASNGSRALHVIDRNNPNLLWPALVEKAYLKIRGGYDFPGSNSGSDLWVLNGWIPEQVFLQSDEVDREALWRRIMKAFEYGDVLITLGTGKTSESEAHSTGLPGEHDYAVINLEESSGKRLFLVKNPWSEGGGWVVDTKSSVQCNSVDHKLQVCEGVSETEREAQHSSLQPGTFWMNINDVFQHFESLYLNWNPGLFAYREDVHFSWDISSTLGLWASFGSNPQYQIHSKAGGIVWLVLSRHFRSSNQARGNVKRNSLTASAIDSGFISLYLFQNKGDKVYLTDSSIIRGPYVDSPNTLLKTELPASIPYTVVISEQKLDRSSHSFTLSAFSLQPLLVSEARDKYNYHTVRSGAWTSQTAGGNASSPDYFKNPQFSIDLPRLSDVSLLLELKFEEFPIHVKLVWGDGRPVRFVNARDVLGDSGEYRKGHAFAEIPNVPAGRYTVVCSTFEQGQLGAFNLEIGTMSECMVQRILMRPAGQFVSRPKTAHFIGETDRLWTPLQCSRLTRLSVLAQSHDTAGIRTSQAVPSSLPLRVSLEIGHGLAKRTLASSGNDEYSNGYYGVQITDVDIQPYMCPQAGVRLVLERAGPLHSSGPEGVDVEVYSDANIEVGSWLG